MMVIGKHGTLEVSFLLITHVMWWHYASVVVLDKFDCLQ